VTLKVVPKAACDSEIVSKAGLVCREISTNEIGGKPKQKFDVAFATILQLESVLKEASRIFIFIFLFDKAG
jgi:hypothetical protein